jgi:hypothetical protein
MFIKAYLIFFITLERSKTRQDKFERILEIIESVVSSPFVKAEADSIDSCTVFETVYAFSLAMIGEHLHLTFADHLDLYSQQEKTFFKENIPAFSVQRKSRSISVLQQNLVTIIQNISES